MLIHILILYLSPKQIPGGTHPVSSHVLPYFGIHYLYPASLPLITCLNSNATSIVIFLLFFSSSPFPLFNPHLEWPVKALWLATTHTKNAWLVPLHNAVGTHTRVPATHLWYSYGACAQRLPQPMKSSACLGLYISNWASNGSGNNFIGPMTKG